jgi:hypothetical protein
MVEKRRNISVIIKSEAVLCLTSYERELKLEEQEKHSAGKQRETQSIIVNAHVAVYGTPEGDDRLLHLGTLI